VLSLDSRRACGDPTGCICFLGDNSMKVKTLWAVLCGIAVALLFVPRELNPSQTTNTEDASRAAILAVLSAQQEAWNRGDIEGFMKGYWNSPQVTFAGSNGITRGWVAVLARYRMRYPDTQAMGHADFSELEVYPIGKDAALVLGRWHLKRASNDVGGVFTLVFQRFPEGWRIIHDHTSADANPR